MGRSIHISINWSGPKLLRRPAFPPRRCRSIVPRPVCRSVLRSSGLTLRTAQLLPSLSSWSGSSVGLCHLRVMPAELREEAIESIALGKVQKKCPLRVNRVTLSVRRSLPVYPRKRTSTDRPVWSVSCQRRKSPLLFDHLVTTGEHLD